jgi:hypothetical protein
MWTIWTTWRQQSRRHPSVLVLTLAALLGMALGPILAIAGMPLLAQFVAGIAIAPLALAVYLCLLLVGWAGGDGGSDGPGGPDDPPPLGPDPSTPDGEVDWERFEREFWAHVAERTLVH